MGKDTKSRGWFCTQPDRHEPKLKCGYPMPCPHHSVTVLIDVRKMEFKKRKARKTGNAPRKATK